MPTTSREAGRQVINDNLWYETGPLSSGDHTLTMTYYEGDKDFQLDRIVYTPVAAAVDPPPAQVTTRETTIFQTQVSTAVITQTTIPQGDTTTLPSPSSTQSTSGSSSRGASSIIIPNPSSAANSSPPNSNSNSNFTVTATQFIRTSDGQTADDPSGTGTVEVSSSASKKTAPTGAIVGAVIAALAAIILLLLLVCLIRRRRRRRGLSKNYLAREKDVTAPESGVTPFEAQNEGSREGLVLPLPHTTSRKLALSRSQVAYGPTGARSQEGETDNSDTIVPMPTQYDSTWNSTHGFPEDEKSAPLDVGNSLPYPSTGEPSLLQADFGFAFDSEVAPAYFQTGREQGNIGPQSNVGTRGSDVRASVVSDDLPPAYDRRS
ncbi:hypothetical protein MD484_g6422, partial [Candolleomyces efflorescens]